MSQMYWCGYEDCTEEWHNKIRLLIDSVKDVMETDDIINIMKRLIEVKDTKNNNEPCGSIVERIEGINKTLNNDIIKRGD